MSECYNYYYTIITTITTTIIIIIQIPQFTAILLVLICTGLTDQAFINHCLAKNFLIIYNVLSITAFCIRIQSRVEINVIIIIIIIIIIIDFLYNYINEELLQQCKRAFNCYLINCNTYMQFLYSLHEILCSDST